MHYRDFQFGNLLHLVMTDERLYRHEHVASEEAIAQAQGHDPIKGSDSIGARYLVQQPVLQQVEAGKTTALGRAVHPRHDPDAVVERQDEGRDKHLEGLGATSWC